MRNTRFVVALAGGDGGGCITREQKREECWSWWVWKELLAAIKYRYRAGDVGMKFDTNVSNAIPSCSVL